MTINPTAEQIRAYRDWPSDQPVFMLNLLKFKTDVEGEATSGEAAYGKYADSLDELVRRYGGGVQFLGRASQVFVGDEGANDWDVVLLVRYPSRKAFLEMIADPAYQAAHSHREQGLANTVLIACDAITRIG